VDSDRNVDALFIGYENQENLGLRYIMAALEADGYCCRLIPFNPENPLPVVEAAKHSSPALIGFSIIFQYTLSEFRRVTDILRSEGIRAHLTAGGHFPSLRPKTTLTALPALDTVVRFEGEITSGQILANVDRPEVWPSIQGLAFRQGGDVVVNAPRPLISDLDTLPWPHRGDSRAEMGGLPAACSPAEDVVLTAPFVALGNFTEARQVR
jgi:hypothetical protein